MANLTLYLTDELAARAKAAAAADGRSISNWLTRQLEAALRSQFDTSHPAAVRELAELRARSRQVDLEELAGPGKLASAIARTVESGPQGRSPRQPRRGK